MKLVKKESQAQFSPGSIVQDADGDMWAVLSTGVVVALRDANGYMTDNLGDLTVGTLDEGRYFMVDYEIQR